MDKPENKKELPENILPSAEPEEEDNSFRYLRHSTGPILEALKKATIRIRPAVPERIETYNPPEDEEDSRADLEKVAQILSPLDLPENIFAGKKPEPPSNSTSPRCKITTRISPTKPSPVKIIGTLGRCLDRANEISGGWFDRIVPTLVSVLCNLIFFLLLGSMLVSRGPVDHRDWVDVNVMELDFSNKMPQQKELEKIKEIEKTIEEAMEKGDRKDALKDISEATNEIIEDLPNLLQTDMGIAELAGNQNSNGNDLPDDFSNLPDIARVSFSNSALMVKCGYGGRAGETARKDALKKYGGSDRTEEAVRKSLDWLAKTQNDDGSWGGKDNRERIPTLTGLALLTFLAHGENLNSKKYGAVMGKGLKKLIEFAEEPGITKRDRGFGHAIVTYALAEAAAVTGLPVTFKALDKRLADLLKGMNKFGTYNIAYDNRPAETEKDAGTGKLRKGVVSGEPVCNLSFAGWNYQALRAANVAGLPSDELSKAMNKGVEALVKIHQAKKGGFSFGINQGKYEADPEMIPVGTLCLQLLGAGKSRSALNGFELLKDESRENSPEKIWSSGKGRFPLYTWYYQTQAIFNATKGTGNVWKKWNAEISGTLIKHQAGDGSWISPSDMDGDVNGMSLTKDKEDISIYSTALCSLILQVYYRYLPSSEFVEVAANKKEVNDEAELGLVLTSAPLIPSASEADKKLVTEIKTFEIGKPNGKPKSPNDELVEDEFKVLTSEWPTTQVKAKEEFPQVLFPNQRIAWQMNKIIPEKFGGTVLVRLIVGLDEEDLKSTESFRSEPILELVFNNKMVWKHKIPSNKAQIFAVLPSTFLEEGLNILQIRNTGNVPVAFDWICAETYKIETPVFLAIEDLDMMPRDARKHFRTGLINLELSGPDSLERSAESKPLALLIGSANLRENPKTNETEQSEDILDPNVKYLKRKLSALKKSFEEIKIKYPHSAKTIEDFYARLEQHLKMGLEPMIKINADCDCPLIECVANTLKDTVKLWMIEHKNKGDMSTIAEIIKEQIPSAMIGLKNTADKNYPSVFNLHLHSEKEVMPLLLASKDEKMEQAEKREEINSQLWGMWSCKDRSQMGVNFQKNYIRFIPAEINEWIWGGGSAVILKDVVNGGKFFDNAKGAEKLAFHGLKRVDKLFQGCKKLFFNVTPLAENYTLDGAYWSGVLNDDGIATLQISSRYQVNNEVEIVCPIPWSGKTEIEIESGFVPDKFPVAGIAKFNSRKETLNIEKVPVLNGDGGVFTKKIMLTDCVTIRLVKAGCKIAPPPESLVSGIKLQPAKPETGIAQVIFKHSDPLLVRTAIRYPNGIVNIEGPAYSGKAIDATKDDIDGARNVIPWDSKSTLIEINYPEDKPIGNEGARVYFGGGTDDAKEFSFWVYPRVEKNSRKKVISMRMVLDDRLLSANVRTDEWQRIVLPCDKINAPCWKNLCILGDPQDQEYRKGRTVSFELNGFAVYGNSHKKKGLSGLESARAVPGRDSITFLLLGKPGMYGEYRYLLKNPLDVTPDDALKENKISFNYNKNSQIIQINLNFPKENDLEEIKLPPLTNDENKLIKEKGCIPVLIKAALVKPPEPAKNKTPRDDKHKNLSSGIRAENRK